MLQKNGISRKMAKFGVEFPEIFPKIEFPNFPIFMIFYADLKYGKVVLFKKLQKISPRKKHRFIKFIRGKNSLDPLKFCNFFIKNH